MKSYLNAITNDESLVRRINKFMRLNYNVQFPQEKRQGGKIEIVWAVDYQNNAISNSELLLNDIARTAIHEHWAHGNPASDTDIYYKVYSE